jgi:fatty acid desaturase
MSLPTERKERKINWYRSPLKRDDLSGLNQRSDWKGLFQTGGYLGLLVLTGAAAFYAAGKHSVPVLVLILFLHGTFYAFLLNAFHEFCHKSVFKTKILNTIFLQVVSFLGWNNPVLFWTSHQEHHKYTLHPPDDLEVVLPITLTFSSFLKSAVVNPWDLFGRIKSSIRLSFGRLEGDWENALFPASEVMLRRSLFNWARIHLLSQVLLVAVSLYLGLWLVPVLVTLAPFYGGWLLYLCNNTQHIGLQDNVPDFRLCCRTIILNPFIRFLYWHMNYHTEHHMYAAVPCYNLGKLHQQIEDDLPHCPVGLIETWKEITAILNQQKVDPKYQYIAELPTHRLT